MASKEHVLLTRAAERFSDLTDAERKLLHAVIAGEVANYRSRNNAENDPQQADTWDKARAIRAKVLRWLCVDREASCHIDPQGIRITAARIEGRLDLDFTTISVPFDFRRCAVKDGVTLTYANTRSLAFIGSSLGPSGGPALTAIRAHVSGDVFLSDGFYAKGAVRLAGASIVGHLTCSRGAFHHSGEIALSAGRLHVSGDVFLARGFRAEGEVFLAGASIDGNLDCGGGTFLNPAGRALDVTQIQVGGTVALRSGFHAEGTVRLDGASIDSDLDCRGGTFHNSEGDALSAMRVQVKGEVNLSGEFRAEGIVRFENGRADRLLDNKDSWPAPGNLRLNGFVYASIGSDPMDAKTRLAWLARQPSTPFRPQPYLQLAKVLRESGHEPAAKRVLIEKERERRKHGALSWLGRRWNWLLDVTIGYGYQPWLALIWAGGWVVVGGLLFGRGDYKEIVIPTKAEAYQTYEKTRQVPAFYPSFNRWFYALDTFVPIINFGLKEYWGPQMACNKPGPIGGGGIRLCVVGIRALYFYRWIHIIAGWVLITLVVTGFTNLVRRE